MILILSPDASVESSLGKMRTAPTVRWDDGWLAASPETIARDSGLLDPDMVFVGPGVPAAKAVEWIGSIAVRLPNRGLVFVGDVAATEAVELMRAGATDILPGNCSAGDFETAVDRGLLLSERAQAGPATDASLSRRVMVVRSPRGGAGRTAIATNLAVALSEHRSVALVDLDTQFGDVADVLGLLPEHTMYNAAMAARSGLNAVTLKVMLALHESGIFVLAAPNSLVEAEEITAEDVKVILHQLSAMFDVVIVDTAGGINESTLTALEAATDVLMVATPVTPSVRAHRREIDALDLIGMTGQNRHLVLNKVESRNSLDLEEVQDRLSMSPIVEIPRSRLLAATTERAVSLMEEGGRDGAVRAFQQLAAHLTGMPQRKERSLFRRGKS